MVSIRVRQEKYTLVYTHSHRNSLTTIKHKIQLLNVGLPPLHLSCKLKSLKHEIGQYKR